MPVTGTAGAGLEDFDRTMLEFMANWRLPAGQLAIAKDGRLVLTRGYGYAEVETEQPVTP